MCIKLCQQDWAGARRCRRSGIEAMQKEVQRASKRAEKKEKGKGGGLAFGLGDFTSSLRKLLIPPQHPLHPTCPFFLWQGQNLLEAGGRELAARITEEDEAFDSPDEYFSDTEGADETELWDPEAAE